MKKIIAFMLAMIMCISMVACTNDNTNSENKEPTSNTEQVETEGTEGTEESTPNETETPDVNDSEVTDDNNQSDDTDKVTDNTDNETETETGNETDKNTNTETDKEENKEEDKTDETKPNEDEVAGANGDKDKEEVTETTKPTEEESKNETETDKEENTEPDEEKETTPVAPAYTPNQLEQDIFNLINQYRVNAGLPALTFEYGFYNAARTRASEAANTFSHTRPNGSNYTSVFADNGIKWDFIAGENVGRYFADAETAMNAFMNSQVHKDNILYSGYTRVCIAVVESTQYPGYYVIEQLFAGPAGAY